MTIARVLEILEAELLTGQGAEGQELATACGSDLMSDVLCLRGATGLLLTALTNPQAVRTAEMAEIAAVCFVQGKRPPEETLELARRNGLPLLATRLSMFTACGRLFAAGLRSPDEGA
jgi:predicted transcriptional regulator